MSTNTNNRRNRNRNASQAATPNTETPAVEAPIVAETATPARSKEEVLAAYFETCKAASATINANAAYKAQTAILAGEPVAPEALAVYNAFAEAVTRAQAAYAEAHNGKQIGRASTYSKEKCGNSALFNMLDGRLSKGSKVATGLGNSTTLGRFVGNMVQAADIVALLTKQAAEAIQPEA